MIGNKNSLLIKQYHPMKSTKAYAEMQLQQLSNEVLKTLTQYINYINDYKRLNKEYAYIDKSLNIITSISLTKNTDK